MSRSEGYAMLGDVTNRDLRLAEYRSLANQSAWPYRDRVENYLADIEALTAQWTRYEGVKLLGLVETGIKTPMPFVFKPAHACIYCHVTQKEVPQSYLPK